MHNLWKFTLSTGLRAGEVAGLTWDSVYMENSMGKYQGVIEVKRIWNQKTRSIQEFTKTKEKRVIPILPSAREVLEELRLNRSGNFVFGGSDPLDSSHFNRKLQQDIRKIKTQQLPRIHFHGLRHSFCSYLDSTGMNRRIVAEIMGHRDLNTTNRYSHVNNSMMGNEVNRWLEEQTQQKTNNLRIASF